MSRLGRLARFARRRPADQVFALASLVVVSAVRLGLSTLGYRRLRRWLPAVRDQASSLPAGPGRTRAIARVGWAVTLSSRFVPGATCLTQALAGQVLLALAGIASTIRIGARTEPGGGFAAHAWLLAGPVVVLGGASEDVRRFVPLTDLSADGVPLRQPEP